MRADINMKYLRSFLALVQERNSASAAERLGLSRNSLAQHVAAVEKAVGLPLLEAPWPRETRRTGRTQLTEHGLVFFPKAVRALRAHDELFDDRPAEQDPRDARLTLLHGLLELALDAARNNLSEADRRLVDRLLLNADLQTPATPASRLRKAG